MLLEGDDFLFVAIYVCRENWNLTLCVPVRMFCVVVFIVVLGALMQFPDALLDRYCIKTCNILCVSNGLFTFVVIFLFFFAAFLLYL